jgi:DNA-binding protein H-NS
MQSLDQLACLPGKPMPIDVNKLSARELQSLIDLATKRKTTLSKRKPLNTVRNKLVLLAKNEGYTIAELFGGAAPSSSRADRAAPAKARKTTKGKSTGKVAPKYRNPQNTAETWAGRGQQPRWLAAEVAKGRKLEDYLIR